MHSFSYLSGSLATKNNIPVSSALDFLEKFESFQGAFVDFCCQPKHHQKLKVSHGTLHIFFQKTSFV
jgi:hypothetical protein